MQNVQEDLHINMKPESGNPYQVHSSQRQGYVPINTRMNNEMSAMTLPRQRGSKMESGVNSNLSDGTKFRSSVGLCVFGDSVLIDNG